MRQLAGERISEIAETQLYWISTGKLEQNSDLSDSRNPYLTAAYIHEGRHSQHKRLKGR